MTEHDRCCFICKHPSGICLTRHTCDHHKDTRKRQDADDKARSTVRRPTEDAAIRNITRDEKRKGRRKHGNQRP
jgi:hypothetical protein